MNQVKDLDRDQTLQEQNQDFDMLNNLQIINPIKIQSNLLDIPASDLSKQENPKQSQNIIRDNSVQDFSQITRNVIITKTTSTIQYKSSRLEKSKFSWAGEVRNRVQTSDANSLRQSRLSKRKYESPLNKKNLNRTSIKNIACSQESINSTYRGARQSKTSLGIKLPLIQNNQVTKNASFIISSPERPKENASTSFVVNSSMTNPNYQSKENLLEDDYVPTLYVLPQVSCKTYCIIDAQKAKNLYYKGDQEIREIASLTKIMTAIVSLQLAKEMKFDINAIYFTVSQNASTTGGTTAYLRQGQRLKIIDLKQYLLFQINT